MPPNGLGPAVPAFVEHVFEPDVRLESSTVRHFETTIDEHLPLRPVVKKVNAGLGQGRTPGPDQEAPAARRIVRPRGQKPAATRAGQTDAARRSP